ncbi:hypothetical protein JHK87_044464 [Glycine soja]|nr:hypothetical protein JHK87_044464 [Glycine soja]
MLLPPNNNTTRVTTSDVLDRSGAELKILYFLEKLKREAVRHNGSIIITMNGNHEIMNIEGDFSFAMEPGVEEFRVWWKWFEIGNKMKTLCRGLENPKNPMEGIPSSFHGVREVFHDGFRARGLLPQHTSYGLEKINEEVRDWVNGSTGHFSPDYCRG